ncbi:MAG TPA: SpoIIE family protein phosphatase [Terriglobia bacterium]|nr:SpoIIE family protein phosphatase [Terriglobia bacterium]
MASLNQKKTPVGAPILEWSVAALAMPGEKVSGDTQLVETFPNGALVAVVDGLGHGSEAALAARNAVEIMKAHPLESVIPLLNRCHENLRTTRGVVLSMASFNAVDGTLTWLGVGNVEGMLFRHDSDEKTTYESLLSRRGVVGGRLPPLHAGILPVTPGDTLIFATDGIRSGFESNLSLRASPKEIADRILAQHNMETDDALVLVARYIGNTQ